MSEHLERMADGMVVFTGLVVVAMVTLAAAQNLPLFAVSFAAIAGTLVTIYVLGFAVDKITTRTAGGETNE